MVDISDMNQWSLLFTVPSPSNDDLLSAIQSSNFPLQSASIPTQTCPPVITSSAKSYDYVLKFLLVGDSDVGKEEIIQNLEDDDDMDTTTSSYRSSDVAFKSTSVLLYGKRIKLHIWDTSGQGRFSTVFRSYSRGAHGIILVYDITSKWSFNGLDRWLQEIDEHAPGVPKILVGNRKHFEFRRRISEKSAKNYAAKHNMSFLEVSPLCNFNIKESCVELSRLVLERNGMKDFWTCNSVPTLQELCFRTIINRVNEYDIENLPLPTCMKSYLKSFSSTMDSSNSFRNQLYALKKQKSKNKKYTFKSSKRIFDCDKLYRLFANNLTLSHNSNTSPQPKRNKHSCVIS